MKLFQTVVRRVRRVVAGGGQGVEFDLGSDAQADQLELTRSFSLGSLAASMTHAIQSALAAGSDSQAGPILNSISEHVQALGTDAHTMAMRVEKPFGLGSSEASGPDISATADIKAFTSTATNMRNSGSTDWEDLADAQGAFDDQSASFSLSAGIALTTGDATLKCSGLTIPTTPSGFTRTGVFIEIRHLWDLDIATPVVDTAQITLELWDSAGTTLLGTLFTRDDDGGASGGDLGETTVRSSLADDRFDVSGIIGGHTSFQVWARANGSLAAPTSGDMNWDIDGVHIGANLVLT